MLPVRFAPVYPGIYDAVAPEQSVKRVAQILERLSQPAEVGLDGRQATLVARDVLCQVAIG